MCGTRQGAGYSCGPEAQVMNEAMHIITGPDTLPAFLPSKGGHSPAQRAPWKAVRLAPLSRLDGTALTGWDSGHCMLTCLTPRSYKAQVLRHALVLQSSCRVAQRRMQGMPWLPIKAALQHSPGPKATPGRRIHGKVQIPRLLGLIPRLQTITVQGML